MIRNDRRTPEQRETHRWLATATDRFMSGWGMAKGGTSKCAWSFQTREEAVAHCEVLRQRGDMKYVNVHHARTWYPRCAHLSIYIGNEGGAK
jgi:hypothetical protein